MRLLVPMFLLLSMAGCLQTAVDPAPVPQATDEAPEEPLHRISVAAHQAPGGAVEVSFRLDTAATCTLRWWAMVGLEYEPEDPVTMAYSHNGRYFSINGPDWYGIPYDGPRGQAGPVDTAPAWETPWSAVQQVWDDVNGFEEPFETWALAENWSLRAGDWTLRVSKNAGLIDTEHGALGLHARCDRGLADPEWRVDGDPWITVPYRSDNDVYASVLLAEAAHGHLVHDTEGETHIELLCNNAEGFVEVSGPFEDRLDLAGLRDPSLEPETAVFTGPPGAVRVDWDLTSVWGGCLIGILSWDGSAPFTEPRAVVEAVR